MNDYAIDSAFSPDNKTLATVGEDLRLWDVESGKRLAILPDNRESLASVDWSPDGKLIATGHDGDGNNDTLRVWRVQIADAVRSSNRYYEVYRPSAFQTIAPLCCCLSVLPAQIFDARSGKKAGCAGWGKASDKNISSLEAKTSQSAVAWLPDGQTLLTGGADGLSVWNRNGQLQRRHREIANMRICAFLMTATWLPSVPLIAA
jgi:WD40 repeat protein